MIGETHVGKGKGKEEKGRKRTERQRWRELECRKEKGSREETGI